MPGFWQAAGAALAVADGVKSLFSGGGSDYHGKDHKEALKKQRLHTLQTTRGLNRIQRQESTQNVRAQRKSYEENGFNPLPFMGQGGMMPNSPYSGGTSLPSIGDSHASAGGLFRQMVAMDHETQLRETELEKENEALRETIDDLAKPSEPGHLQRYGGIMPLPSEVGSNDTQTGLVSGAGDVLGNGRFDDYPYTPGNVWANLDQTIGSQRQEAPPPDNTLQPLSFLGMIMRGTGTTSAAHKVEDNAGEGAGLLWAFPAGFDYAMGTYLHNVGRPFADWMVEKVPAQLKEAAKRTQKHKKTKIPDWGTSEYTDHMRRLYP
ncbi:MAG: hypothetical protein AAF986_09425 [Pseudomonadota bacterium]